MLKNLLNKLKIYSTAIILGVSLSCITGCVHIAKKNPSDPYEGYNRAMFRFNMAIDVLIISPIVTVYTHIFPSVIRTGVANFFRNIDTIPAIINDLLQGQPHLLANDTGRLIVNTTFGIGGLFDVAKYGRLPYHPQSFNTTLYAWGWKDSNYLVLPLLGPSTVRGTASLVPAHYINPITYIDNNWIKYSLMGLKYTQIASVQLPLERKLIQMAIDPYVALRNAYLQNLEFRLQQGKQGKIAKEPMPDKTKVI